MNAQQLQHLYWRAGFGPRPQDVAAGLSTGKALRQLFRDAQAYTPIAPYVYADPQGDVMAVAGEQNTRGRQVPLAAGPAAAAPDPAVSAQPGTARPAAADGDAGAVQPLAARRAALALRRQGLPQLRRQDLTPEQRKMQNEGIRVAFIDMSTKWMTLMSSSPGQLREKVALFWHGHFACRTRRPERQPKPAQYHSGARAGQVSGPAAGREQRAGHAAIFK